LTVPHLRTHHVIHIAIFAGVCLILIWSGIAPKERGTWALETFPVMLGLPLALVAARIFPLTTMLCILLAVHAAILCIGGKYTYAEVPLGFWAQDLFDLTRNHYDRLGHFAQGFVPAILTREILARRSPLAGSNWLGFLTVCVCLAFSALYELFEWAAAALWHEGASAFLGTQGDQWDTQADMMWCLIGAIVSLALLSVWHTRQMRAMGVLQHPAAKA
jgi:putative membrane protein